MHVGFTVYGLRDNVVSDEKILHYTTNERVEIVKHKMGGCCPGDVAHWLQGAHYGLVLFISNYSPDLQINV